MVRSTVWRPPPRRVHRPECCRPFSVAGEVGSVAATLRLRLSEAASEELARHNRADNAVRSDSSLEGDGFEPSVPRNRERTSGANQIFRRTTGAEAYVRRNKAADRLVRRAPDQPSRNVPPAPFLFRHWQACRGAWRGADDLRWLRS
jgi:hypothetical protein